MELWIGAINLGLIYGFMTIGIYLTYKFLDFPDITVDGSFTFGAAITSVLIVGGTNPVLALIIASFGGMFAGSVTGIIHTKMRVNGLLSGILVMIGLYSINLHIMGRSNVPLLNSPSFTNILDSFNPGIGIEFWLAICMIVIVGLFSIKVALFFKSDLGMSLIATGNNPIMSSALGVNVDSMKIFGIALSNGMIAFSGGMIAQYQGFADIGMGIGMIINGLAAVIIGESIFKSRSIFVKIASAVVGSIIFRLMIALALYAGMNPIDLKLLTSLFVLGTLYIGLKISKNEKNRKKPLSIKVNKKVAYAVVVSLLGIATIYGLNKLIDSQGGSSDGKHVVGIVQIDSNPILDMTREGFLEEMKKLGYEDGQNIEFKIQDANGDLATLNSIIDNFVMSEVCLIVTISTPATQVAITKVKDIPVVFATVANPFIINAGTSDSNHLPNVTGVYGWAPMDKTLELVREIFPRELKIGTIWNAGQANSEFNVDNLKHEISKYPDMSFEGATITSTSEVREAATSLVQKKIDAFVLVPENTVFAAFDAVAKVAEMNKIPIFINDVERLNDGALAALGYDYKSSGQDAAHIVNRVLNGEKPADIPFSRYTKLTFGLNNDVAEKLKISFSDELKFKANKFVGKKDVKKMMKIGMVQFAMEPNVELAKEGFIKALNSNGYFDGENVEIIYRNANADFSMINSIMQDLISRDVDIIVPLSTPVVQAAVQMVGNRAKPIVVFTYIYDPYKIGAAKSPTDHLPNFTGYACFPPIERMLDLIKEMLPNRTKLGLVWNSSEANSESVVSKIRQYAPKIGLEVIESTVTNPSEVLDASNALVNKGAQIFMNGGDNTLNVSYDSFVKVAEAKNIPVFSVDAEFITNKTIAILGPNYHRTGFDGGTYAVRVLNGESPAKMPIMQTTMTSFFLNLDVAEKLGIKLSDGLINRAEMVIKDSKEIKK
ncbi:MAG: hypothetical protein CVV22_02205 [Ignavibacteriae bacterium HGW-Ignavibacteriae-1]|jgi:putative ABC transport system permease protein|nr:MAG: hypothetical protein CVV22_02205 [Ignavibacteriae bacterium HGW-Ignavibacteriae-1]